MQVLNTLISRLSLDSHPPKTDLTRTLPDEILHAIFSHVYSEKSRITASQVCKRWRVVIDDLAWKPIVKRAFPEQARLYHFTPRRECWYKLAQRLLQRYHNLTPLTLRPMSGLTGAPQPQSEFVTHDGTLYTVKRLHLATNTTTYKLKRVVERQFQDARMEILSIRTTSRCDFALLRLSKNDASCVLAYNLTTKKRVWQSAQNVSYLFSGGLNLGLGWKAANWTVGASNERQEMPYEALSPLFFTWEERRVCLYNLEDMRGPIRSIALPDGVVAKYVDSNLEGDFFALTAQNADSSLCHKLVLCHNQESHTIYDGLNVLALDPRNSCALYQSLSACHREAPIHLATPKNGRRGKTLGVECLRIAPAEHYKAQIKETFAAVYAKGAYKSTLTIISFYEEEITGTKPIPCAKFPEYRLDSFSLYDDILAILTVSALGVQGPLCIYNLDIRIWNFIEKPVTAILGREGQLLICHSREGLLSINIDTGAVTNHNMDTSLECMYRANTIYRLA
jgi:hypothetical protein